MTAVDLHLPSGLPGFPSATHWQLVELDDPGASPFAVLRTTHAEGIELLVVLPQCFFPGYEPEVSDHDVERLALESAEDALVLVVVTTGPALDDATANLFAPVVVNIRTGVAAQVVVSGDLGDLRRPLFTAVGPPSAIPADTALVS
jgi:flagellar assembly factor FliW